MTSRKGTYIYI